MKSNFVKQQHFIPQFALKYFGDDQKRLSFTRINKRPLKFLKAKANKLMQERDFYEIKDEKEQYILRNSLEDSYSYFESNVSHSFHRFLKLTLQEDFQSEFINLIKNEEWSEIEAALLFYLAQLLIRGKGVKNLIYSKSKLPMNYRHILYLLATTSQSETAKFVKKMYSGRELEEILHFIRDETEEGTFSILLQHIMRKYVVRVCVSDGSKKLFLSDNPVIVQKFEGEDYILPLSPTVCIVLVPIKFEGENIKIDTHIYTLNGNAIDQINKFSVLNTDDLIIISNESDLKFINGLVDV